MIRAGREELVALSRQQDALNVHVPGGPLAGFASAVGDSSRSVLLAG